MDKEYALNNAMASLIIEGYSVTEDVKKLCMDFICDKLDKEQFIKIILERCKS